jgi:hypothetical protein
VITMLSWGTPSICLSLISCELLCMLILFEVREIYHELKILEYAYCQRRTLGRQLKPCSHGGSFSWTKVQTSVVLVFPVWMSKKLRFIKIEKSNEIHLLGPLYRTQGGTPLWHLVKTYVCDENPWKSKLIRTRCEHY